MHKIMKTSADAFHKTCGFHSGQLFGIKVGYRENPGVKSCCQNLFVNKKCHIIVTITYNCNNNNILNYRLSSLNK